MSDNQLINMIVELYNTRQQKADLGKLEDAILESLKPLVDPKFDLLQDQPIVAEGVHLKRSPGENRTISADLLLERGVAPDIIQYATRVSTYFRYLTNKPKVKA